MSIVTTNRRSFAGNLAELYLITGLSDVSYHWFLVKAPSKYWTIAGYPGLPSVTELSLRRLTFQAFRNSHSLTDVASNLYKIKSLILWFPYVEQEAINTLCKNIRGYYGS